jgi:hypothetical protein
MEPVIPLNEEIEKSEEIIQTVNSVSEEDDFILLDDKGSENFE